MYTHHAATPVPVLRPCWHSKTGTCGSKAKRQPPAVRPPQAACRLRDMHSDRRAPRHGYALRRQAWQHQARASRLPACRLTGSSMLS